MYIHIYICIHIHVHYKYVVRAGPQEFGDPSPPHRKTFAFDEEPLTNKKAPPHPY